MERPACLQTCACNSYVIHLEHTIRNLRSQLYALQYTQIRQQERVQGVQPESDCTPRTPPASPTPSSPKKRKRRHHERALSSVPGLLEFRLPVYQDERIGVLVKLTPQPAMWLARSNPLQESLRTGTGLNMMLTHSRRSSDLIPDGRTEPLSTLQQFAAHTFSCTAGAEVELAYGRFQQFLLVLACAVLHARGAALESVSSIISVGMGEAYSEAWCSSLMQASLWVNRLVNSLDDDGWNMRASELLLSWNRKLSFYVPLARSDDNIQVLVAHLRSRKVEFMCTPIFIPLILLHLLPELNIFEICKIIGSNPNLIGTTPWVQSISQ